MAKKKQVVKDLNPDEELTEKIISVSEEYYREAKSAKMDRMRQNRDNYNCYHLKQDYSHKQEGQSQEFLAKQAMAVEQLVAFFEQGLIDIGDWWGCDKQPGAVDGAITASDIKQITDNSLEKLPFISFIGDSLKTGFLGSLMICKVHGIVKDKAKFFTTDEEVDGTYKKKLNKTTRKTWELKLDLIRQEDWYPDPSGEGLYECQEIHMDYHKVKEMAEGDDAIYDKEAVDMLYGSFAEQEDQKSKKADEQGQNIPSLGYRKTVKLREFWGTIIDSDSGDIIGKDMTWTIANEKFMIGKPKPFPFWHGSSPFVTAPIIRVPGSVWHKALMDAPTKHNRAINEFYNLILDAGQLGVHGVRQIRADWLEDENQVANGIIPGVTLKASSACPPGMKVLERVDTAQIPNESINVFNMSVAEFNQSALTNDLRMGVQSARAVKATEVVEQSNAITSVFTGISKVIEVCYVEKILDKAWMTIAQNLDEYDSDEMISVLGEDKARQIQVMSPEERFAQTAKGHKFNVFGVSRTMSKMKDFRKITALLQTIASSQVFMQEFAKKYDFSKLLSEIMKALDINVDKLKVDAQPGMDPSAQPGQPGSPGGNYQAQIAQMLQQEQGAPNEQSQIPQANAGSQGETVESQIPRAQFPGSKATQGQ